MNAAHDAQLRLLDLQAADTALAQLGHRRRTLPELASIADNEQQAELVATELVEAETRAGDIAAEQRRLENDVDGVRTRAVRDEQRLRAGGVAAREVESLQHELATLARRQAALEDELLEVMEQAEQAEGLVTALRQRRDELSAQRDGLVSERDAAFSQIDTNTTLRSAQRAEIAEQLPGDLLALYERAREHGGGVGAAVLRQRRCEGCHIELSGSELAAVRGAAPDEVVRCDNCRRILVRTDESGL